MVAAHHYTWRYQLEDIKRTSIDRAVSQMVITPAGETAVQAAPYRIKTVAAAAYLAIAQ